MVKDNVPYVKSVVYGMFNGCAFFTRLKVKTEFTVKNVLMN